MKLNLLSKTKSSKLSFTFSTFICAILFLFFGNANAQTTVQTTLSAPTADSYGSQWVTGTAYNVNDLVYFTDNTGTSPVVRVWKVTVAGTSTTTAPTGTADVIAGATYAYLGTVTQATSTWTCPTGVTSIDVELWGGGGAGGSASTASATSGTRLAGGGGAGSYVKKTLTVVPGTAYNVTVGGGGFPGATSQASGYFGLCGGKSQFSGTGITTLTASGGTGGSGTGSLNPTTAPGGVLGGVYGYTYSGTGTNYLKTITPVTITGTSGQFETTMTGAAFYVGGSIVITSTSTGAGTISGYVTGKVYTISATNGSTTFTLTDNGAAITTTTGLIAGLTLKNYAYGIITGGGGSGAVVTQPTGSNLAYVGALNQGSGYTSRPTVTYSNGTGHVVEAYVNPNINSAGDIVTLGSNGSNSTTTASGAGGANAQGLAGGAAGTGTVTGGYVGTNGAAVGSGGGGGISFSTGSGTFASAKGGSGANGQIIITYTAPITTYAYTGTGDLHNVLNWADASNNRPTNFTTDFQIFKINSNVTTTAAWTVSGAASKVVVGDSSTTNVSLTIASGFGITGTLDVTNGNKVYDRNLVATEITTTTPSTFSYAFATTYGTLADTSEVHYQNNDINSALLKTAFSYGKLYVDGTGSGNVFFSGLGTTNHNVRTYFEVAANSIAQFSETSTYYLSLNSGASAVINGTVRVGKAVGFVSTNVGTAGSTLCALQFLGAESLTLGANSTIEYNRAESGTTQNVTPRTDYKNLFLSGANNNKSFAGATTVSGTLKLNITGTSTISGAANLTLGNGATITRTSGSLNASPIFGTTTNVIYDGTTAITTSFELPALGLNNVTINNAAGVTSSGSNTINGVLNFISGKLITGNNFVTIGTSGSITGAGTGWVVGNLIKQTASNASPSFNFAIGDTANYTPISLTFNGNNTAATTGNISASTTVGDHPQVASSGLDNANSVNRTWTLLNNGVTGFTDYSATLNYAAADNDASSTPANYVVRKYDGSSWFAPATVATPTASSATANGFVDFGDFAVGTSTGSPTVSLQPLASAICGGTDTSFTASAATSALTTSTKWQRSTNGTVWSDITSNIDAGTTYSNFTTGTLTLTGSAAGLNNYQYRAVFTSINGSTNSNAVTLTVNTTAAPTASAQSFCNSGTVAGLTATGSGLQWFSGATGGTALATTTAIVTGNYFVSQTLNACEGPRTSVAVTINTTAAPTGAATQSLSSLLTISSIVVTGTNVVWYASSANAAAGTNPLPSTTPLTNTTYYATQTVGGCTSTISLAVTITTLANQNFELDSIKLFPNPSTSNFVTITSSIHEDIDVVVYDIFGKHILTQKVIYNTLDVSDLHSGMYLLKISQKEKTTIKKLIIK
ncbi:MAG: T9SS type A sorting domain-containing protein [Flavobacterium sp.]|nr:T9SS type A sorting domain-containing protein [Flavobacterium sp.]